MRRILLALTFIVICRGAFSAEQPEVQLREPWESQYAGEDATGKHVVALWTFDSDAEMKDASGHGHDFTLDGAKINPAGRFGACLESFRGWPVEDKRHHATVKNHPALTPKGPFTIEMWICAKPELESEYPSSILFDKKYVSDNDYQWVLDQADRNGSRVMHMHLGFGADSSSYHSQPAKYEPDVWHHIAFTYDGAGTGSFFIDGKPAGSQQVHGRKNIVAGGHNLFIGDRVGSLYHGLPGFIDQVRLTSGVRQFARVKFQRTSGRSCFSRMEPDAGVSFSLTNHQREPLVGAVVTMSLEGLGEKQFKLADLKPGEVTTIDYPIDTALRPDAYRLIAQLRIPGPKPHETEEVFPISIVPRQPADRFPVVMWGGASKQMDLLKQIGFTHVLGVGADVSAILEAGKPIEAGSPESVASTTQLLDEALAADITMVASLSPGSAVQSKKEFQRVNRKGELKEKHPNVCGLFPEIQKLCYNVGASVAKTYGRHPAFGAAMIHTEVRDGAYPCFHAHDREAFKQQSGLDIPAEVTSSRGVNYSTLPNFPASRVIPDDHPLYVYYKWYWKQGDGWPGLNTQVVRGLKTMGRKDFWTYHDPAVRVASVYGSGGEVDFLSQWTYSYPDPIRIGIATDELLTMAAGSKTPKQVMKMTQIIWYRGQTAPAAKDPTKQLSYKAQWEKEQPDAPFITIAPMHLREAFWTKIARPIKGIMYHGWSSLVHIEPPRGYRFTNPETRHELTRLTREVVRPLGPTLLKVPPVKSDVAFLESFASQMFAQRGTYGWCGGWGGDAYLVMLYAHFQPEIVYDETIVERGLDGFKVLVMCHSDVITQKMAERIKAFQAGGGIIVGDESTTPAIKPDVLIKSYKRTGKADADKAVLLGLAAQLRKDLEARSKYARYVDTSNPEVIPYRRRHKQTDYVFLVNDRREYGEYVGQHGIVMENGLPSEAVLTIARPAGFVYDLVAHGQVPTKAADGKLALDVSLGPCDGRLLMVSDRAIGGVNVKAPEEVNRGSRLECLVEVVDAAGKPLDAVVPVELTIRDASGRVAEFSGSYAAVDGKLQVALDIASNDPMGVWQIDVRELASGRTATRYFRVHGPKQWPPDPKPIPKDAANPVQPRG